MRGKGGSSADPRGMAVSVCRSDIKSYQNLVLDGKVPHAKRNQPVRLTLPPRPELTGSYASGYTGWASDGAVVYIQDGEAGRQQRTKTDVCTTGEVPARVDRTRLLGCHDACPIRWAARDW